MTDRIATLDIVRGVAVMGILAMNVVAFAMPFQAYLNPVAYGIESAADLWSWYLSFILVDGKMRGLFSFLFGASVLLVLQRAEAAGTSPERVHFRRMAWLWVFGLLHFYLVWFGDILALYAPLGMLAWFLADRSPRALIGIGAAFILIQFLLFASFAIMFFPAEAAAAAPGARAETVAAWRAMSSEFAALPGPALAADLALYRGDYAGIVTHRIVDQGADPFTALFLFGWETFGYLLFGMAALKSGFLAGAWDDRRYARVVAWGFGLGIPIYALLGGLVWRAGFGVPELVAGSLAATVLVRPVMIVATAALIILATRRGGGPLVARIAAAGRAAFTNYLGTSLIMTGLFYGYGLGWYGTLSRAELWLVVLPMWALMLLWSKPWLDRFRYGPFEWLWRSLARWEWQTLRRA